MFNLLKDPSSPPNYTWLFLRMLGYVVMGYTISISLGMMLARPLYGVDMVNNPYSATSYGNPKVLDAYRFIQFIGATGAFLVPAWVFALQLGREPLAFFKIRTYPAPKYFLLAIALLVVSFPMISFSYQWNMQMELPDSLYSIENKIRAMENDGAKLTHTLLGDHSLKAFIGNLLVMAFLPALLEEITFRGVFQSLFIRWTRSLHAGVWLGAFLFSFIHFQFYGFLPRFILGAVLGYLFLTSRSLWPSIVFHLLNNSLGVCIEYFDLENAGYAFLSDNYQIPWQLIVMSVLTTAFILFRMHRKNITDGTELDPGL